MSATAAAHLRGLLPKVPFGLPRINALVTAYRAGDPAALEQMSARLAAERAAASQAQRLQQAVDETPALRGLVANVYLGPQEQQLFTGPTLITERVQRTFALASPQPSVAHCFHFSWRLERSLMPQLMPPAYEAVLTTRKVTASARQRDKAVHALLHQGESWPAEPLMHAHDSEQTVDAARWAAVQQDLLVTPGTARDLAWLVSFLCSHPTDYAFDIVSDVLFRR